MATTVEFESYLYSPMAKGSQGIGLDSLTLLLFVARSGNQRWFERKEKWDEVGGWRLCL